MDRQQRTFADWTTLEVSEWLKDLPLSRDYSTAFQDGHVNGAKLLKINQLMLDKLQVYNQSDRLVLLHKVMMMRADHDHTPISITHSDRGNPKVKTGTNSPTTNSRGSPIVQIGALEDVASGSQNGRHISRGSRHSAQRRAMECQIHVGKKKKSGVGPRHCIEVGIGPELSKTAPVDLWALAELLKEENASLRKHVEYYYSRAKKLQKMEQEIEQIREANQLLEASTQRREALEKAMRKKLEDELRQQKETTLKLQVELQIAKANAPGKRQQNKSGPKKDIERRDSVIIQLLWKQRESSELRERLEADLLQMQAQLREERRSQSVSDLEGEGPESSAQICSSNIDSSSAGRPTGEAAKLYLSSIEGLRSALLSLKGISQKRERLEERLRHQLESEVESLRSLVHQSTSNHHKHTDLESQAVRERDIRIAALEADLARVEQKCMELSTENQMTVDAATLPRDAHLSHLARVVQDQAEANSELKQQKINYIEKLYNSNKRVADLESRLQSMQATITEKDSLIRTLQEVFQNGGTKFLSRHPFQNVGSENQTHITKAASSDNIAHASPPASPSKRRRMFTDMPVGAKKGLPGLRSPPRRVGSLMRAASYDQLADHRPRSVAVKGQSGLTEGWRSATPQMRHPTSDDDFLNDDDFQPAPRRVKSVDVRHPAGRRLPKVDLTRLTQVNRVKSCDSVLEEGCVSCTNSAIAITSSDGGVVRLLTKDKAKLTNQFLDSLAKATSIESISSASVGSSPASPLLQPQKVVHRFSALSPTFKQRCSENDGVGLQTFVKCRSASCDVLDNPSHHMTMSHGSLSDGELDHPWYSDSDQEVTNEDVDNNGDVFFVPPESSYVSNDSGWGSPSFTPSITQSAVHLNVPTPVSSLAKVTQKVVVRKRSVDKLPLTAWTTTPPATPKGTVPSCSHSKLQSSHSKLQSSHAHTQPLLV